MQIRDQRAKRRTSLNEPLIDYFSYLIIIGRYPVIAPPNLGINIVMNRNSFFVNMTLILKLDFKSRTFDKVRTEINKLNPDTHVLI